MMFTEIISQLFLWHADSNDSADENQCGLLENEIIF